MFYKIKPFVVISYQPVASIECSSRVYTTITLERPLVPYAHRMYMLHFLISTVLFKVRKQGLF